MRVRPRRSYALAALLAILIALVVFALISNANEINQTRSDFCDWAAVHVKEARTGRSAAARADAASDERLSRSLGCSP